MRNSKLILLVVIVVVIVVALVGCEPLPVVASGYNQDPARVAPAIKRYVDCEARVVIYAHEVSSGGGLAAVPLYETALVDACP